MQKGKGCKVLIFLDVETTGIESMDRVCSIGIIGLDSGEIVRKHDLINEGKKISSKASSVNHITNEMIKDKPKLKECDAYEFLQKHNSQNSTLVAHHVKFALKMLQASGFEWRGNVIDTLRATKHLIPECEEFSLQFLRYELKLYKSEKTEDIRGEGSLNDALHVKHLYEYLLEIKPEEELRELSSKKVLMQKFDFGKYSGRYIEDISTSDRSYLEWMLGNISELDEDLRYSIERYL